MDVEELLEIESIKKLKYTYLRCLDTKEWDEMADCFVEDATCAYDSGVYAFEGRSAIVNFLRNALGPATMLTLHQCHHPEIELTSPTSATGRWYLEDAVIDTLRNTALRGAGFYRDEYVKVDGTWKLRYTGYDRTFEEISDRSDTPSLKITKSMFAS